MLEYQRLARCLILRPSSDRRPMVIFIDQTLTHVPTYSLVVPGNTPHNFISQRITLRLIMYVFPSLLYICFLVGVTFTRTKCERNKKGKARRLSWWFNLRSTTAKSSDDGGTGTMMGIQAKQLSRSLRYRRDTMWHKKNHHTVYCTNPVRCTSL